jgi:hypothetical protein
MTDPFEPKEVEAIRLKWGGLNSDLASPQDDGSWRFTATDGMRYLVYPPGSEFPVFEDSGRPCGTVQREDWAIRCTDSAPDDWFTVAADGVYEPWAGGPEQLW